MHRRDFVRTMAGGAIVAACGGAPALAVEGPALEPWQLRRIGMTTVCLRDRIPTNPNQPIPLVSPSLPMLEAPAFIRDTFGLTNIEVWNFQFADDSPAYCRSLRAAAERAGCRIFNLQLDGDYDLSSKDDAVRERSITFVKDWMQRASLIGAPMMRANIDSGNPTDPFDPLTLVPTIRLLGDYGRTIGVKLLIENHLGHSKHIANVAKLLSLVKHENVGGLLDWGNSEAPDPRRRIADFSRMFPYLSLVSAKGLHFDAAGQHVEYPIRPIVLATERSGYGGIYSVELYTESDFPDPLVAVKSLVTTIAAALTGP